MPTDTPFLYPVFLFPSLPEFDVALALFLFISLIPFLAGFLRRLHDMADSDRLPDHRPMDKRPVAGP